MRVCVIVFAPFFLTLCAHVTARVSPPVHRCEVDLCALPANQRQLFTLTLSPARGVLVFLLAVRTCSGVSVSDLGAAPLDQPHHRQRQLENYVSTSTALPVGIMLGFLAESRGPV